MNIGNASSKVISTVGILLSQKRYNDNPLQEDTEKWFYKRESSCISLANNENE